MCFISSLHRCLYHVRHHIRCLRHKEAHTAAPEFPAYWDSKIRIQFKEPGSGASGHRGGSEWVCLREARSQHGCRMLQWFSGRTTGSMTRAVAEEPNEQTTTERPQDVKGPPQPVFHTPISSIFSAFSMEVSPELCDWEGLQSGGRYRLQKVERPRATAGLPTLCLCVFPRAAFSNPLRVQGNDLLVCVSEPQAPAYLACGHALN